ncbi:MAG: hypothetical protein IAI50_07635 [Candidatus Eremiobacteraeota bacterium]|nr:hypothetical protein [Candidatus Eremiobacteraeota bacterium]
MSNLITRFGRKALILAGAVVAVTGASAPVLANENPMSYKVFNGGSAARSLQNIKFDATKGVSCGIQFTGTIPAATTYLYFTYDWKPAQHVFWDVMPTTTYTSSELSLANVATQLSSSTDASYWLTIVNNSASSQSFQGRYCIL